MELGRSKEDLVVEEKLKPSSLTSKIKWLVAVAVVLAVVAVLFIGLYAAERRKLEDVKKETSAAAGQGSPVTKKPLTKATNPPTKSLPGIDVTADRVQVAASVISRMDLKANPCEDFYKYSCGGWLDRTAIPDSKTRFSTFSELALKNQQSIKFEIAKIINGQANVSSKAIKDAVKYYSACLNTKSIEKRYDQPLKSLIRNYGSWPVTDKNFSVSNWNWSDSFMKTHKFLALTPIFNMYVSDDLKNSSNNVIVVNQGGLGISREAYLKNSSYHTKVRNAYRVLMKKIVVLLGANKTGEALMDKVFDFEKKLANMSMPLEQARQYNKNYQKLKLKDFANQTNIPVWWLKSWFNWAFNDTGYVVTDNEDIITYSKDYIKRSYELFNSTNPIVQSSYIMWKVVHTFSSLLLGKYKEAYNEYYTAIQGTTAEERRWEICLSSTSSSFGFALGRIFVDKSFRASAKTMADEMIKGIRKTFIENIDTLTWMDLKTKMAAKDKAKAIIENIGYPKFITTDEDLDKYYRGLIVRKDMYFENVLSRRRFNNLGNYEKLGKKVDKSVWAMIPSQVNAYYSPTENKIVFPAGILQPPFYDHRAPRALNYGAIGVVVGHEITHGFDDQGKNFNKDGNSQNWWTAKSEQGFKDQTKCLVDQYSKYSLYNRFLNGNQTLGENIADNGGSKAAFKAYQEWVKLHGVEKKLPGIDLTPEQLFFVGFGQVWCSKYRESAAISQIENGVHSISKFRVIGTLHNSKEFAEVFKCPKSSYMNRETKCSVW